MKTLCKRKTFCRLVIQHALGLPIRRCPRASLSRDSRWPMTSLIPSDNPRSPISMVLPIIPPTPAIAPVCFRCWSISVAFQEFVRTRSGHREPDQGAWWHLAADGHDRLCRIRVPIQHPHLVSPAKRFMTRVETSAVQPVGVGITIRYRWRRRARSRYPRCAPGT